MLGAMALVLVFGHVCLGLWWWSGSCNTSSGSKNDFISFDSGRGLGPSAGPCPSLIGKNSFLVTLGVVIGVLMGSDDPVKSCSLSG